MGRPPVSCPEGSPTLVRRGKRWATRSWDGPGRVREDAYHTSQIAGWRRERTTAGGLLAVLGRRPKWLLGDYLSDVRVDPRAPGFFHDGERAVVWRYLIGIDLIPTPGSVWCVEANLHTAALQEGGTDLWDSTGAIGRVFSHARGLGMKTVWRHEMDFGPVSPWLYRSLEEVAEGPGLGLIIREGFRVPSDLAFPPGAPKPRKRLMSPISPPGDTLVIRQNDYRVGSDFFLANEEPFIRGMHSVLSGWQHRRCRFPPMTGVPPDLTMPVGPGLPNLVYRYPGSGKGKGVYFFRVGSRAETEALAREMDQNTDEPPSLFQPFVCSKRLPGRRVQDCRCELLVSPLGVLPVLEVRREAMSPIPAEVGSGLPTVDGVFTTNLSTGRRVGALVARDRRGIDPAADAVGEGLAALFSRGFVTQG